MSQNKGNSKFSAESLGSSAFKKSHGVKYAYYSGSMYRGIASKDIVIRMGQNGFMGFLGAAGLSLDQIAENLDAIQAALGKDGIYGANLIYHFDDPPLEMKTIELFLEKEVSRVEASAFMEVTPALALYRLKGLSEDKDGKIQVKNRIIAKVSRPETAEAFVSPAPKRWVEKLLAEGKITETQARLSEKIPMSDDICVEADSGGHTDQGVAIVILPAIRLICHRLVKELDLKFPVRVGMAGGLGSPEAIAAAFVMGADFVCTGSINQCTIESGTSDTVKDLLEDINIQDTDYAPAGDMFEIGAKIQVLKKGSFFPTRANKLFMLYNHYNGIDEIPQALQTQIQEKYFKRNFEDIYQDTKAYFNKIGRSKEIERAERDAKHKMALIFRWYFGHSMRLAFEGDETKKIDYQVHTGSAMGAFNQWAKGTELEKWRNRHVDEIAIKLMHAAADVLNACKAVE